MAGDVPIFELFEVAQEDLFFASGVEFDLVVLECLNGFFCERLGTHEPLFFEEGLQDGVAFVAVGDGVGDALFAAEEILGFEVG